MNVRLSEEALLEADPLNLNHPVAIACGGFGDGLRRSAFEERKAPSQNLRLEHVRASAGRQFGLPWVGLLSSGSRHVLHGQFKRTSTGLQVKEYERAAVL